MDIPGQEEKQKKQRSAAKRVTDIILCVLIGFILVAAVIFNVKSDNDFTFFGYSGFTMLKESMQSEIPKGSLIITKKVNANSITIGNDITFTRNDGAIVTHRIINITENYKGSKARGFKTQGIENPAPDDEIVCAEKLIGVVAFSVPGLGSALDAISGNMGIVLLLLGGVLIAAIVLSRFLSGRKEKGIIS